MVDTRQAKANRQYTQEGLFSISDIQLPSRGTYYVLDPDKSQSKKPQAFYAHPNGEIWLGDAITWLKMLQTESVNLIFADPPLQHQEG